jgi:hypothetical protein
VEKDISLVLVRVCCMETDRVSPGDGAFASSAFVERRVSHWVPPILVSHALVFLLHSFLS